MIKYFLWISLINIIYAMFSGTSYASYLNLIKVDVDKGVIWEKKYDHIYDFEPPVKFHDEVIIADQGFLYRIRQNGEIMDELRLKKIDQYVVNLKMLSADYLWVQYSPYYLWTYDSNFNKIGSVLLESDLAYLWSTVDDNSHLYIMGVSRNQYSNPDESDGVLYLKKYDVFGKQIFERAFYETGSDPNYNCVNGRYIGVNSVSEGLLVLLERDRYDGYEDHRYELVFYDRLGVTKWKKIFKNDLVNVVISSYENAAFVLLQDHHDNEYGCPVMAVIYKYNESGDRVWVNEMHIECEGDEYWNVESIIPEPGNKINVILSYKSSIIIKKYNMVTGESCKIRLKAKYMDDYYSASIVKRNMLALYHAQYRVTETIKNYKEYLTIISEDCEVEQTYSLPMHDIWARNGAMLVYDDDDIYIAREEKEDDDEEEGGCGC